MKVHNVRSDSDSRSISSHMKIVTRHKTPARNSKTKTMKQKILFVISLLFGLMFINSELNKFFNYFPIPADLREKLVKK